MIFRISQKLNKKLGGGTLNQMPLGENPYADWSAHLFTVDRTQYILLSNTASLYSCVTFGRGNSNESRFIERAVATIREQLEDDGQASAYQRFIAPETGPVRFAKSLNRSVTSSMNQLIMYAEDMLVEQEIAPLGVSKELNGMPLTALGDGTRNSFGTPEEAFKRLADAAMNGRQQP